MDQRNAQVGVFIRMVITARSITAIQDRVMPERQILLIVLLLLIIGVEHISSQLVVLLLQQLLISLHSKLITNAMQLRLF